MTARATPLQEARRTRTARPRKVHKGLDAVANRVAGFIETSRASRLDSLRAEADQTVAAWEKWRVARMEALAAHLVRLGATVRREGKAATPGALRCEALAAVAEAAWRTVRLRAYPEQLMGSLALERNCLAEMATGEGKTLTIGLAAALAAWRGGPVHVITANDYLVKRDAEWLREFYELCGLRVGFVTGLMSAEARRAGYAADVTYTTSKEIVADFLRDRLQLGQLAEPDRRLIRKLLQPGRDHDAGLVMRGLQTAIVDEADHVLVDEAVTPLIISRETASSDLLDACRRAAGIARGLEPVVDYIVEPVWKDVELRARTRDRLALMTRDFPGIWRSAARREELIVTALKAREFFRPGQQYVVDDKGKIVIIDESTGRVMAHRIWKQGLHQAIEAKEGVPLTPPTETMARLSFQRFFRLCPRLCGVTGTAREARGELWQIYARPVVVIPTHRPCVRERPPDRMFLTADDKWRAVVDEVRGVHSQGAPVLVGTRSVEASEQLAARLREAGLECALLNAVQHAREAQIVAEAGQGGRITIATNMAGRGTDIKLGAGVAQLGGLCVIATEMHESGRVDRQLFGRCARQGEPGKARLIISLEDELPRRFLSKPSRRLVAALLGMRTSTAEAAAWAIVRAAQRKAERIAFRQRRSVLAQDDWLDESLAFAATA
jgi:preprotein translocase subunit SecA